MGELKLKNSDLISSIIICVLCYSGLFLILNTIVPITYTSCNCPTAPPGYLSAPCDCISRIVDPLGVFSPLRILIPIILGFLFYYFKNKPDLYSSVVSFFIIFISFSIFYVLVIPIIHLFVG